MNPWNAKDNATTLMKLAERHHDLTLELYGMLLASKPKIHFLYHIIMALEKFGGLFHCFSAERFHKLVNSKGKGCFGPSFGNAVLPRILFDFLEHVEDESCLDEIRLEPPLKEHPELNATFQNLLPHSGVMTMSAGVQTSRGRVHKGDAVSYEADGLISVGLFHFGAAGRNFAGHPEVWAILGKCIPVRPRVWRPMNECILVPAAKLGEALAYTTDADELRPLKPWLEHRL